MVFTLGPSAHLGSLATGHGLGTIASSSGIARFVQGGVVKTFRQPSLDLPDFTPYHDQLPDGWFVSPRDHAEYLAAELAREIPEGHLLDGVTVSVVAHRDGTDDILCWHCDDLTRFTVVHLSWLGRTEINAKHPTVECDGSFDDFLGYERGFLA